MGQRNLQRVLGSARDRLYMMVLIAGAILLTRNHREVRITLTLMRG